MSLMFFDAYTCFGPKRQQHGKHPWTLDQLIDELAHCSISGALVASTAQTQYDAMLGNRRLSERLAGYDHLFPLWHVLPHWTEECPPPRELMAMLAEEDVRAVSIAPNPNGWPLGSRQGRPLLDALEAERVPVVMDYADTTALELEDTLARYPQLPVIVRGATWGQQRSVLPLLLQFANLHVTFDRLQINRGIEWLVSKGCEDQLLFGSNAPGMSAGAHRFYVDYADLPQATREKIASGNLIRLLRGQRPPTAVENASEDSIMAEAREGRPLSVEVIDMHCHMLDEGLNGAGGGYTMLNGGPSGQVEMAARMGVDAIGMMSWDGSVGVHAEDGNACVSAALDAVPDSWWGLATFDVAHLSEAEMVAQMRQVFADKRYLGLKPYLTYGVHFDDPRYDCWWQFGSDHGLYAGMHPSRGYVSELGPVCERFPGLTVVAYHAGGSYEVADQCIELANKYANFMIEITLTPVCGGIVDYLVAGAGVDRVMYGSDQPMRDPRQQLGWVVYSKLSLEDKKRVLGGNARQLIDRIRARRAAE